MVNSRVLLFLPDCLFSPDSGYISYPSSSSRNETSNLLHNNQLDCELLTASHNSDIHPHSPHLHPQKDGPFGDILKHDQEHPYAVRTLPIQLSREFDSQRTLTNN